MSHPEGDPFGKPVDGSPQCGSLSLEWMLRDGPQGHLSASTPGKRALKENESRYTAIFAFLLPYDILMPSLNDIWLWLKKMSQ